MHFFMNWLLFRVVMLITLNKTKKNNESKKKNFLISKFSLSNKNIVKKGYCPSSAIIWPEVSNPYCLRIQGWSGLNITGTGTSVVCTEYPPMSSFYPAVPGPAATPGKQRFFVPWLPCVLPEGWSRQSCESWGLEGERLASTERPCYWPLEDLAGSSPFLPLSVAGEEGSSLCQEWSSWSQHLLY